MNSRKKALKILSETKEEYKIEKGTNKGLNSKVFKIKDIYNNNYALKLYSQKNDKRGKREKQFLEHSLRSGATNSPILKEYESVEDPGWIVMSWIEAEEIVEIDKEGINAIIDFTSKIRNTEGQKVIFAKDANTKIEKTIEGMRKRNIELKQKIETRTNNQQVKTWIRENIITTFEEIYNNTRTTRIYKQSTPVNGLIMSVSDVGIHNMKRNGDKYFFYDFEYAGKDDSAKLFCDIILQPRHKMSDSLREYTLEKYINTIATEEPKEQWLERASLLSTILKNKWMMIMCNSILKEKGSIDGVSISSMEEYAKTAHHNFLQRLY